MDLPGGRDILYGTGNGHPYAACRDRDSFWKLRDVLDPVLSGDQTDEICDRLRERILADLSSGDRCFLFWRSGNGILRDMESRLRCVGDGQPYDSWSAVGNCICDRYPLVPHVPEEKGIEEKRDFFKDQ